MDIDSSKTANKRIRTNWTNEEVPTLLSVWKSHTNKKWVIDPSIKISAAAIFGELSKQLQDNAFVTSADNNKKLDGANCTNPPTHPIHMFFETHH